MKQSDNYKNFAKTTVSTGYTSGATSIVLNAGDGAKLPATPFDAVWWDATTYGDPTDDPNREVVSVTTIAVDTLTITRGVQGTSASSKNTVGSTYKLVAPLTAKGQWLTIIKDADGTPVNNSTTLVADGDLTFAIAANEVWEWEVYLRWTTPTNADLKFDFSGPAAATLVAIASTKEFYPGNDKVSTAFSSGLLSASHSGHASGDSFIAFGSCINGANAGSITLQIAQWSAVAENTKILAGTRLRARRVA